MIVKHIEEIPADNKVASPVTLDDVRLLDVLIRLTRVRDGMEILRSELKVWEDGGYIPRNITFEARAVGREMDNCESKLKDFEEYLKKAHKDADFMFKESIVDTIWPGALHGINDFIDVLDHFEKIIKAHRIAISWSSFWSSGLSVSVIKDTIEDLKSRLNELKEPIDYGAVSKFLEVLRRKE
ncbi:MAG: hypothetical protein QXV17_04530 [Candidatus Micrarchaeaceae archaeon]